MKKTMTKNIAAILAVMTMITAGSAFAVTANAASADNTTISVSDRATKRFDLTNRKLTFKYMTDIDENVVNPYVLFGSSFRVTENSMFMAQHGDFAISLGANKGESFGGIYVYDEASEKIFLHYNDGFNAAGYVTIMNDGNKALGVPMKICDNIYTVYFAI